VVENASLEGHRILTTLGALSEAVAGLEGPALLIIGEVAALADVGSPAQDAAVAEPGRAIR
jgi:siroheme synthase